jgi:uridine kinase
VLVLDGMFLHRDELAGEWDVSVLLDVPFAETLRRMAGRDGSHPDPEHPSMRRYVEGQRLYLRTSHPSARADLVVDNTDVTDPQVVRRQARR